jgi:hypothetical protein
MNAYWFQMITNLVLIAAIIYFVMNDHPLFAFLLFLGLRVIGDKDENT